MFLQDLALYNEQINLLISYKGDCLIKRASRNLLKRSLDIGEDLLKPGILVKEKGSSFLSKVYDVVKIGE